MDTKKKYNKFEKVSPEQYIKLAQKDPSEASKEIRKRYGELSDYTSPNAIGGIFKDERAEGWFELARLLSDNDPALAKSIYIPLLRARNFTHDKNILDDILPDMEEVAEHLYKLEERIPEKKDETRLAVLSTLVKCSSPTQTFWAECFEQTFRLAYKYTMPEKTGYIDTIASLAYYEENVSTLRTGALQEISQRLRNPTLFDDEPRTAWNKGYFFKRMSDFCIKEKHSARNNSFPANPGSAFYAVLCENFWQWIDEYIQNKSYEALTLLQHGIHSHDKELSLKASEVYIDIFHDIARENPEEASSCLREIANYSCCYFTDVRSTEEKHQNFNLYEVFDKTIPILKKMDIDKELHIRPFFAFIKSHGNVPIRMKQKYGGDISAALSIQINMRKSNSTVSESIEHLYPEPVELHPTLIERGLHFFVVYGIWLIAVVIILFLSLL